MLCGKKEIIPMVDRRLVEYNIGRLRDKNPTVRIKSIGELRLLDDQAGWEAIAQLFQVELEANVKQAAREALAVSYLPDLRHPDPAIRLKTIQNLRTLAELSTMEALEQVYRTDQNPVVQQAAQEAGREIYLAAKKR
jgi:hypothetical protein